MVGSTLPWRVCLGVGRARGGRRDRTGWTFMTGGGCAGQGGEAIKSVILKDYFLVGRLGAAFSVWRLRSSLDNPGGHLQEALK